MEQLTLVIMMILIFGLVGLFLTLKRMNDMSETDLLDKMFKNNDIDSEVYKNKNL